MAITRAQKQQKVEEEAKEQQQQKQEPQPAQQQEQPPQCSLFKLPGELRNRIYRDVLVKSKGDYVVYTVTGHERPGLLNTSKEIRAEAMKIYYYENSFKTVINAFDSTALIKKKQCLKPAEIHPSDVITHTSTEYNQPSWKNLLLWLRRYHGYEVLGRQAFPETLAGQPNVTAEKFAVSSLFSVVHAMRNMPWARVEGVVKGLRPTLVNADVRWAEE